MPSIEKKLETKLKTASKLHKFECLKLKCIGESGFMDRTVIFGINIYFVELKDSDKYADPLQVAFAKRLRRQGHIPVLINSFEKLDKFLFYVIHAIPIPADSDLTHFEKPGRT